MPDLSVYGRQKTLLDAQQLAQEFMVRKAAAGGQLPAALQVAKAIQQARASGNAQLLNDIVTSGKLLDRGVVYDANGNPVAMGGYGDAVGSIEGAKAAYKEQGQKNVDLAMNPQIERLVTDQKNQSDLAYNPQIKGAETIATLNANQVGALQTKADSAFTTGGLTNEARRILTGRPDAQTGVVATPNQSYLDVAGAFANRVAGRSTEATRADTALNNIAAQLTGSVPRMEGPQSDADRAYYEQQAGRVGDRTLPIADRKAALDEIDRVNAKYANIQTPTKNALMTAGTLPGGLGQTQLPAVSPDIAAAMGDTTVQIVKVSSPQQAAALPAGTKFQTPDGQVRVKH